MDGQYLDLGLADALGSVRAEIAALKERERQLRAAILASPGTETGREFDVFVRRGTSRRLNRSALPDRILNDPRYWIESVTTTVVTRARDVATSRASGQCGPPAQAALRATAEEGLVIEDM